MKSKSKKALGCACEDATLQGPDSYAKEVGLAVLPKIAVWGVGIGAVYFLVLKPLLQKFGVIKTTEEKKNETQISTNQTAFVNPFNPRYWTGVKTPVILTQSSANSLAQKIYDAIGNVYDDENIVYGAFRQLKAKTQVSFLADVFFKKYSADLYNYLQRNLNASELAIVNGIVNGLA